MMSAVGMKKNSAATVQMVSDDGPELAADAIQRGPSTVAMLKNKTSQKFISLRSWDLTSGPTAVDKVRFLDEARKITRNAASAATIPSSPKNLRDATLASLRFAS